LKGHWGRPADREHYCNITGKLVASIYFPSDVVVEEFGNNNGAAILQPDNVTILQLQPLYRCDPGSPILGLDYWLNRNESILGDGIRGAHGGSGLSAIGGTVRLGELLPHTGPIQHALKLELFAQYKFFFFDLVFICYC